MISVAFDVAHSISHSQDATDEAYGKIRDMQGQYTEDRKHGPYHAEEILRAPKYAGVCLILLLGWMLLEEPLFFASAVNSAPPS